MFRTRSMFRRAVPGVRDIHVLRRAAAHIEPSTIAAPAGSFHVTDSDRIVTPRIVEKIGITYVTSENVVGPAARMIECVRTYATTLPSTPRTSRPEIWPASSASDGVPANGAT